MSAAQIKEIQDFANKYNVEVTVVGSRVNPNKALTPGSSDWDYLLNPVPGSAPTKALREAFSYPQVRECFDDSR